jgi:TolA-binding protein
LNVLLSRPETKAQIQAAEKAEQEKERIARAAEALTNAQKLQSAKKDDQAYLAFKSIVSTFPGTPSATTAADEMAKYEKDSSFVQRVTGAANDSKAKAILSIADNYKAAGKTDLAKQKYQSVIDQFPGTPRTPKPQKRNLKI